MFCPDKAIGILQLGKVNITQHTNYVTCNNIDTFIIKILFVFNHNIYNN